MSEAHNATMTSRAPSRAGNPAADAMHGFSADEIARVRAPLPAAWTLPARAYTDEAVHERECERVLRRSWHPLARLEQLAEPGDYRCVDLLGQPLVVVHGRDGRIRVLSRVCLHRGAPIVEGEGRRNLFTCPYHAWSYDTTGALLRSPLMESVEDFAPERCRLPELRTEIWQGFVMANLDPDAAPFAPQVLGLEAYFEPFRLAEQVVVRSLEFDSHWNWKVLVENFMEAYHHIATHSRTFEPDFHAADSRVLPADGPWQILHMPRREGSEPEGMPAMEGLERFQARDLFANVVFPHFLFAVQGNGMAWYQVLTEGVDRLRLVIHLCVPRAALDRPNIEAEVDALAAAVDMIHAEDIEANDLVWRGLNSPLAQQGRLAPLEAAIWQLNQWWLDAMALERNLGEGQEPDAAPASPSE